MQKPLLSLALIAMFLGCSRPPVTISRNTNEALKLTSGAYANCPPWGSPGFDNVMNILKNRDVEPSAYTDRTIAETIAHEEPIALKYFDRIREKWPEDAADSIGAWESTGARMEGYIFDARFSDPEPCNCGSKENLDIHMRLVADSTGHPYKSVIAEISPRILNQHPNWKNVTAWKGKKVRVSGWMFWDGIHTDMLKSRSRATLWEIHPIMKLDTLDASGNWIAVD